jgi:hypothetical protein
MQTQHISEIYKDAVSITQVRRDIGVLLDKLDKEPEVKVLKGQKVLFVATSPKNAIKQKAARKEAVDYFAYLRKKHKSPLSDIVIRDRDRMRTKTYYATNSA